MNHPVADRPKILVVDDTPANLVAMRQVLSKSGAQLIEAKSGNEALAACLDHEFALILLDVQMPAMDGFEVAQLLSGEDRTRDTPIIFVTAAAADDLNRIKGYGSGAVDYIAKPINEEILRSKVRVFLELYRGKRALRQAMDQLDARNRELESEVERRKAAEDQARHQATHDTLTGLPNRLLFLDRLSGTMERSKRRGTPCALFYVDIDGFKPVNDTHGHNVGDELLKAIARRMSDGLRKMDTVARLGGDEFAIVMEEPANRGDCLVKADGLCRLLSEPFDLNLPDTNAAVRVKVGASIGIALFPTDADNLDGLIRCADDAMYKAKRGGKGRCVAAQ